MDNVYKINIKFKEKLAITNFIKKSKKYLGNNIQN